MDKRVQQKTQKKPEKQKEPGKSSEDNLNRRKQFRMSDETADRIEKYSERFGMSESSIIRLMIRMKGLKWIENTWMSSEPAEEKEVSSDVTN